MGPWSIRSLAEYFEGRPGDAVAPLETRRLIEAPLRADRGLTFGPDAQRPSISDDAPLENLVDRGLEGQI